MPPAFPVQQSNHLIVSSLLSPSAIAEHVKGVASTSAAENAEARCLQTLHRVVGGMFHYPHEMAHQRDDGCSRSFKEDLHQGSMFSLLLFPAFTNGLLDSFDELTHFSAYVDDLTLAYAGHDNEATVRQVQ